MVSSTTGLDSRKIVLTEGSGRGRSPRLFSGVLGGAGDGCGEGGGV